MKTVEKTFKSLIRQALEDMGYSCAGQDIEFYLSFMKTKNRTVAQDPHIDFKFPAVDPWYVDESPSTRRAKRGRRHDYTERVPFIAFFPLTEAGMAVEVWPARADHRTGRDGVLVHIPFGSMMIARGDVVHAGGFSSFPNGNPRCHLYSKYAAPRFLCTGLPDDSLSFLLYIYSLQFTVRRAKSTTSTPAIRTLLTLMGRQYT